MAETDTEPREEDELDLTMLPIETDVQVRSATRREIDVRLVPWDTSIETLSGPEMFVRGAFADIEPSKVLLMGLEHEVFLGAGQDGRVIPTRHPTGKALSIEERPDGAYATFRVAKTQSGDEILALAEEGVVGGISVEIGKNARIKAGVRNGRRVNVVEWSDLRAASPTYQPAYADARVLAVRSQQEDAPVAEDKAPANGATDEEQEAPHEPRVEVQSRSRDESERTLIQQLSQAFQKPMDLIVDRLDKQGELLDKIQERARASFEVPGATSGEKPDVTKGQWMEVALKILSGERIPDQQFRSVADFITTDNAGIVPDTYSSDLIGVIDPSRPFMASTRRLDTPSTGLSLVVPKITQRPTTAVQGTEKTELSSQKTTITTQAFDMVTIGGTGDISLQLLKRADRSFLALYLELLGEAYAMDADDGAVGALITAINDGGPEPAGALDPNDLTLGAAFETTFDAIRRPPDTIWMSTGAISAFIDAKDDATNRPLYGDLSANFSVSGGAGGTILGLRPVHVPSLDDKGAYAIVGPSSGFAWAEDGTYTLQVDVPSKAGRDVSLVGMLWFAPYYPAAFTLYNVAS